ncbi:MAG: hypothetical protein K6F63_09545, partial [Lachnospiraceae bacterium]|nr:hypothetical protein [Lachnospiraceae bacterium]
KVYAYKVYACNEAGKSEKASEILWGTEDKALIEEFKGRLERGEFGAVKEEEIETPDEFTELMSPEEEEEIPPVEEKSGSVVKVIILIFVAAAVLLSVVLIFVGKKGRKKDEQ